MSNSDETERPHNIEAITNAADALNKLVQIGKLDERLEEQGQALSEGGIDLRCIRDECWEVKQGIRSEAAKRAALTKECQRLESLAAIASIWDGGATKAVVELGRGHMRVVDIEQAMLDARGVLYVERPIRVHIGQDNWRVELYGQRDGEYHRGTEWHGCHIVSPGQTPADKVEEVLVGEFDAVSVGSVHRGLRVRNGGVDSIKIALYEGMVHHGVGIAPHVAAWHLEYEARQAEAEKQKAEYEVKRLRLEAKRVNEAIEALEVSR